MAAINSKAAAEPRHDPRSREGGCAAEERAEARGDGEERVSAGPGREKAHVYVSRMQGAPPLHMAPLATICREVT